MTGTRSRPSTTLGFQANDTLFASLNKCYGWNFQLRKFVKFSCRIRYLGRSGATTPPIFGGNPKGAVLSNRLLARTLTAFIVLNVGCAGHAQRVVDQGTVIEDVTLISPEQIGRASCR